MPKGWNKSVVMDEVLNKHPGAKLVFFGDRICPGGNDLPLAEALDKANSGHLSVPIADFTETWRILETGAAHGRLLAA